MHKILIVEDDRVLRQGLTMNFRAEGYSVLEAESGSAALKTVCCSAPDLIVLDLGLPDMHGLQLCRSIRAQSIDVPVIVLSGMNEEMDRVLSLETGADDYMAKPFSVRELLARIRLRLRDGSFREAAAAPKVFTWEGVTIEFLKQSALVCGQTIALTHTEVKILRFLITHEGQVISRETLLGEIWGDSTHVTTRTVDNHLLKIRQKLEATPSTPVHFLTVYGGGYKFVA